MIKVLSVKKSFWATAGEYLILLIIAYVLALGIRMFVAERRDVPTSSMEPTIHAGDSIFTLRAIYYFRQPQRGDIVLFNAPARVSPNPTYPWVKRLIGLPGDTVEVRDGKTYVNGKVYNVPTARKPDYKFGPVKVKNGMYLVFGDNRNESYDSHYWGFLPEKDVFAEAVCVIWPINHIKILD